MFKKLITNSFSNLMMRFLNIALVFIMTPIILTGLGRHDYGIWEIVMSVTGYMGLLEFGVSPAIVRYVARYNALGDREKLNQVYSSFFIIFLCIGFFCSLIICGWAFAFPEVLAEKGMSGQKYTLFLLVIAFQVLEIFPGFVIQCFHEGFQRYNLINFITAVQIIITNIILYYVLKNGYGLVAFAIGGTASHFVKMSVLWGLLLKPRYGQFQIRMKYLNKETIKELYLFGLKSFLLGIASRISFNTDSIVIGAFLGPAVVAFYVIPVNLINKLKGIMMSITLAFMPHFTELYAKENNDEIIALFLLYSRYAVGIAIFMFSGAFFLGLPFINIWIGPDYGEQGRYILYIIGLALFLPFFNPFQGRILTSKGKHGIMAKVYVPAAMLNISLSLILVNFYGKEGVAFGTLIPAIIVEPIMLMQVARNVGFKIMLYVKSVLLPQCFPAITVSLLYFILSDYIILDSYLNIFLTAIICSSVYIFFFSFFIISKNERRLLFHKIKKLRK